MKKTTNKRARLAPIIITGQTGDGIGYEAALWLAARMPMTKLEELLRARSIPIPKAKDEMVHRLAIWISAEGSTFTLELR